ncbi:putative uncharacterized protein MYH16 [Sphaerodactylus townsendi]|uniref:putative uncharacterized protein MYH16 n=1 Tax=Sphaerodactylus townsendi TaxID=933632 RepID=UPI0020275E5D|nr:putative uncharacterized protein MYH16 [Sphaerodactylus townsendi]
MSRGQRKNSIPDKAEKAEMDKIDLMMEMMKTLQKDTTTRFNEMEDKLNSLNAGCNKLNTNYDKIVNELSDLKEEMKHIKDIEVKVEKIEQQHKEMEEEWKHVKEKWQGNEETFSKLKDQILMAEVQRKEKILRFRGVVEEDKESKEKLRTLIINNVAKYLDTEEDVIEDDIENVVRLNYRGKEERKYERDILVFFSRKRTRDEILIKNSKTKMIIEKKEIVILKEVPTEIRSRRKKYEQLATHLRETHIRFRWDLLEGLMIFYHSKRIRISNQQQAEECLKKIQKDQKEIFKQQPSLSRLVGHFVAKNSKL